MKLIGYSLLIFIVGLASNCKTNKTASSQQKPVTQSVVVPHSALPNIVIVKLDPKHANLVPIRLSADKQSVAYYPSPTDVITDGVLLLPTALKNGYYLDNLGLTESTCFLKVTLDEYSKRKEPYSQAEMLSMVISYFPITEIYTYGTRSNKSGNEIVELLNSTISNSGTSKFTPVK